MESLNTLAEILTVIMNMAVRPPGLRPFARVNYRRELCLVKNPNGSATATIWLYGWEYKRRHPKPKVKPKIDVRAIKVDLNEFLGPKFMVSEVYDCDTHAKLTIWRIQ